FLIFFSMFGILYFIYVPLFTIVPDESAHWLRAYEISRGHFISQKDAETAGGGRVLPKAVLIENTNINFDDNTARLSQTYRFLLKHAYEKIDKNDTKWIAFSNTAYYPPLTYAFQLPGILAVSLLSDKTVFLAYAGRVSSFIISLAVLYFALGAMPAKKKTFFLIALCPVFVQEAVSLSGDALVNAVSFAVIALILKYSYDEKIIKINLRTLILITFLFILASAAKAVYIPIVLLFLVLPYQKIGSKTFYICFFAASAALCVFIDGGWLYIMKDYSKDCIPGTNSKEQIAYVLNNPVKFILLACKTYIAELPKYAGMFVGIRIGAKNTFLPIEYISYFAYILFIAAVACSEKMYVKMKDKIVIAAVCVLTMFAVAGGLYAAWNVVGSPVIDGIQGRYFVPVVLLLAVIINIKKFPLNEETLFRYSLPVVSVTYLFIFSAILIR
ncbi:MAG: DUF2142 domain-containing protein, partial [Endomicrobia bacterium]|nr:DUF2142 domain-containing protein [Endomicrobiia bacterium]